METYLDRLQFIELMENEELNRKRKIRHSRKDLFKEYNDKEFHKRFRLNKKSVSALLELICDGIKPPSSLNNALQPMEQLLPTLRYFAIGTFQIVIGDLFGVHQSTASRVIERMSRAIAALAENFIMMPETEAECQKMSIPAWACDVSNFISPPEKQFICTVCKGVFCDPMQTPCNHVFCKNCITWLVKKQRNCPLCRRSIKLDDLEKVIPLLQNLIHKLKLRCHNAERGCKEIITQEFSVAHLRSCIYELVRCSNRPCTDILERKMIADHKERKCLHAQYPCERCGQVIYRRTSKSHDCITSLKSCIQGLGEKLKETTQLVPDTAAPLIRNRAPLRTKTELEKLTFCYLCKKGPRCDCKFANMFFKVSFPAWTYDDSNFISPPEEFICSVCSCVFRHPVQCPCNHVFCRECIRPRVLKKRNCPVCHQVIRLNDLKVAPSFENKISKLPLSCCNAERGCEEIITQEGSVAHLQSCLYELVQCSISPCTDMLERRMIADHEERKCQHAKYPCERCGQVITLHTSGSHDCITYLRSCAQDLKKKWKERKKLIKKINFPYGCPLKRKIQECSEEDS